jgi:nucleoside-diphosphate-sugar epimerase
MACIATDTGSWPQVTNTAWMTDVRHRTTDQTRAAAVLGFRAQVALADGLIETWRHHRAHLAPLS